MIPVRDDQPRFSTPFVTYFLIGLNSVNFSLRIGAYPRELQDPALPVRNDLGQHHRHLSGSGGRLGVAAVLLPALTSMFLHGSWMHVIGNMWFLWIFGDNIEDHLGHFKYLVFYLASGLELRLRR